jgi:signal transduction histidine kinase
MSIVNEGRSGSSNNLKLGDESRLHILLNIRPNLAGQFKIRDLIIGEEIIPSRSEFKRLMLTGYLSMICMAVAIIYPILDAVNGVYYSLPAYVILFFLPAVSILLIRKRRYKMAKILLMVSGNMVVFFAAVNDPFETGVFLFFIPTGIGLFAILEFKERNLGLALTALSLLLFLLAYFGDLRPSYVERPSESYIQLSLIFNYCVSLTISVLMVHFLMSLNDRSETELIAKGELASQRNKELQKVNEELDRFVYSVSHDLRSPLSSILGLTNLAKKASEKKEVDELLSMIQGRVEAQDHFIREIIDYSRNARTETISEIVSLKELVDETITTLKFNSIAERIHFKNDISASVQLVSDKTRLSVILNNLISNSIKYHDINKEKLYIEINYDDAAGKIRIKDNGIGIKPEHIGKIFHMFFRGSDRSTGSGLGLFITKEAVEKLGGKIEVTSVYGEGSTFTIYLPNG